MNALCEPASGSNWINKRSDVKVMSYTGTVSRRIWHRQEIAQISGHVGDFAWPLESSLAASARRVANVLVTPKSYLGQIDLKPLANQHVSRPADVLLSCRLVRPAVLLVAFWVYLDHTRHMYRGVQF